ncbi:hypothetical protein [Amycolatopsis sp. NPDC051128]|uniref:hypothetical protein n=1 Tax=Amycolatopsis sp. NPDC051128 TaxID=3155412 RepID=UPI00342F9371
MITQIVWTIWASRWIAALCIAAIAAMWPSFVSSIDRICKPPLLVVAAGPRRLPGRRAVGGVAETVTNLQWTITAV